jgi:hypothetical protein
MAIVLCSAAHLSKSIAGDSFGGRCAETLWLAIDANGLAILLSNRYTLMCVCVCVLIFFFFFRFLSSSGQGQSQELSSCIYVRRGFKKRGHEQGIVCE